MARHYDGQYKPMFQRAVVGYLVGQIESHNRCFKQ